MKPTNNNNPPLDVINITVEKMPTVKEFMQNYYTKFKNDYNYIIFSCNDKNKTFMIGNSKRQIVNDNIKYFIQGLISKEDFFKIIIEEK